MSLENHLSSESGHKNYFKKHPSINYKMRKLVVEWLKKVNNHWKNVPETHFLAVKIFDTYLEKKRFVNRKNLQLIGSTALWLAMKFEEPDVGLAENFVIVSAKAFTEDQILLMEIEMLKTLDWNVNLPTSFTFVNIFCELTNQELNVKDIAIEIVEKNNEKLQNEKPSLLAAKAIFLAKKRIETKCVWSKNLKITTGYTRKQVIEQPIVHLT